MAALRKVYGYRSLSGLGVRHMQAWLEDQAELTISNEDIDRRFIEECRRTQTILPAISTVERLCADALVVAKRRIEARIADRLSGDLRAELLVTLARFAATQLPALHHAQIHEQEPSGAAWVLEWMTLPGMAVAAARSLTVATGLMRDVERVGPA